MSTFCELLRARMDSAKITQSSLGRSIGVHRTTVSDYLHDKYLPNEETFRRIHQIFPDKELYDCYFSEVNGAEPRKNKPLIPEATPYNFYKAAADDMKATANDMKAAEEKYKKNSENSENGILPIKISTKDRVFISTALSFLINHLEDSGIDQFCPNDYGYYVQLLDRINEA